MDWVQFKFYLSEVSGLSQDALHVYAAVAVQFAAALTLRRPISHPLPWLCLVAILAANEAVDLFGSGGRIEQWQVLGGMKDVWNTLALPTFLLLLARYAPSLMTNRVYREAPASPPLANVLEDADNR